MPSVVGALPCRSTAGLSGSQDWHNKTAVLLVSPVSQGNSFGLPASVHSHICQIPSSHDHMLDMHSFFMCDRWVV
jgi:hypothetical protein